MLTFANFLMPLLSKNKTMVKSTDNDAQSKQSTRLDKWLWAARFYKTRAIAKQMIDGGKVFYNGQRSKSGKAVVLGDRITIRQGFEEKHVIVHALADKRRDATFAQTLYVETSESIQTREKNSLARQQGILLSPASDTKPDKKQRRQIRHLKERI
jgi:ribosome-associated heat shock protein Hsp15